MINQPRPRINGNGTLFDMPPGGPPKKERSRNREFDALGVLDGVIPPTKASAAEAGRIVRALKVIRQISPDVAAEEIESAAEAYRRHWPDIDISSTALAAHWRKFNTMARAARSKDAEMSSLRAQMTNSFGDEYEAIQRRLTALEDQREG